jgi:hypothetical protein
MLKAIQNGRKYFKTILFHKKNKKMKEFTVRPGIRYLLTIRSSLILLAGLCSNLHPTFAHSDNGWLNTLLLKTQNLFNDKEKEAVNLVVGEVVAAFIASHTVSGEVEWLSDRKRTVQDLPIQNWRLRWLKI